MLGDQITMSESHLILTSKIHGVKDKMMVKHRKSLFNEKCIIETCRRGKNNCASETIPKKLVEDFNRCTYSGYMLKDKDSKVGLQTCNSTILFNVVSDKVIL